MAVADRALIDSLTRHKWDGKGRLSTAICATGQGVSREGDLVGLAYVLCDVGFGDAVGQVGRDSTRREDREALWMWLAEALDRVTATRIDAAALEALCGHVLDTHAPAALVDAQASRHCAGAACRGPPGRGVHGALRAHDRPV